MSAEGFDAEGILGPGGAVARAMPGYEARPEQVTMAAAVGRALAARTHLRIGVGRPHPHDRRG
jgi:hypothetical protein